MKKSAIAAAAIVVFLTGCATQSGYVRDGETYGVTRGTFRGRWWSFYERGVSFMNGGFHEDAAANFERALKGRREDAWQARTYGLHFTEYFPNRELGVACYHLDRLDEAEEFLQRSLSQVDTARAHHYMDLVTRAKIARGDIIDEEKPTLAAGVEGGLLLASRDVSLQVDAADDVGVHSVRVDGRRVPQRGSPGRLTLSRSMVLPEGRHRVAIEATDLADRTTEDEVEVTVDLTGPTIGIFSPAPRLLTDASTATIRGAAVDRNGVVEVRIGDRTLVESEGRRRLEFETEVALEQGLNRFVVAAVDAAGNETRTAVDILQGTQNETAAFLRMVPDHLLKPMRMARVSFSRPTPFFPGVSGRFRQAALTENDTASPVRIELRNPGTDIDDYRKREVRVAGYVEAETRLASVMVGDDPVELVGALHEEFSRRVPVAQGENLIVVRAEDTRGNTGEREVKVKSDYFELDDFRMGLAVVPFGGTEAVPENTVRAVYLALQDKVVSGRRFQVVERQELDRILLEQEFSAQLGDADRVLALGASVPAQVLVRGDVVAWGDNGVEVKLGAISTETRRIVKTLDAYVQDMRSMVQVNHAADALAEGLVEAFPRLTGTLLGASGSEVVADIGAQHGLPKDTDKNTGMYLVLTYKGEDLRDEETGDVLIEGRYEPLGRARIVQVTESRCRAELVKAEGDEEIPVERGMPVITF